MRHRRAAAAIAVAAAVAVGGCSSDPQAWLSENCTIATGTLKDGQPDNPTTYLMGVGYSPSTLPLYEHHASEDSVTPAEQSLPSDVRVCFNAEAWEQATTPTGSEKITVMPVAWDEEPDWDHYVKVTGRVGDGAGACRLDVERTGSPCEGDEGFFHVDREESTNVAE